VSHCYYHEEFRASATCPNCQQRICDRCRLNGAAGLCQTCHTAHAKGGESGGRVRRLMCVNHPGVPVDTRCKSCMKPHCPACLNGAQHCFRCALEPKTAKSRGTARLGRQGTSKLGALTGKLASSGAVQGMGRAQRLVVVTVGIALVTVALGAGVSWVKKSLTPPPPPPPYTGPGQLSIANPPAKRALSGNQLIRVNVSPVAQLEYVEVFVDGKRWDSLKKSPFQSEWPTHLLKNGRHVVEAKAVFRGGKKVLKTRKVYVTRNRFSGR
jgi:hypothetical protein